METDEAVNAEEKLLNILSSLAGRSSPPPQSQQSVVSWLADQLASPSSPSEEDNTNPWASSMHTISSLLPSIEPRDLHAAAVQGIVFSDGSTAHVNLCLLLCAHALDSCPPTLDRWKRWRSLLCETIALYQRNVLAENDDTDEEEQDFEDATILWLDHLLPACQQVERALPPDVSRVPIMAGMVSIATRLVMYASPDSRQRLLRSVTSLCPVDELCCRPWRIYEHGCDADLDNCKDHLWWWTIYAERDDTVAGMDTSWDPEGLAVLAFMGYEERPLVYSPSYQWRLLFPHASTVLNNSILSDDVILSVLQSLLEQLATQSLDWNQDEPSSPIGTLQLLMNRTMMPNTNKRRVVEIIKMLLLRYAPSSKVALVSTLIEMCPHPGMIPRLLDLLRPTVTTNPVVDYLSTYVDKLQSNHLQEDGELKNVEELVDQVEVYVSVLSMIQLRFMLAPADTTTVKGLAQLPRLYQALTSALQHDDAHFRLNLLENALQQVVALVNVKTQQQKTS